MNSGGCRETTRSYYLNREIETQKLTPQQELELFSRFAANRQDPRMRDEVTRAYLGFALFQAKKDISNRRGTLSKTGLSEDDAISAANYGLMQALDRFDPSRGARFTTYAGWWIKKALHEARYASHVVSVPRGDREMFVLFRRQEADGLTREQIAEFNRVDVDEVERVLNLASGRQDPIELYDAGQTNAARETGDETLVPSPLDGVEREELLERLEEAKNRLGVEELQLLHDRFCRNISASKLARRHGCTPRMVEERLNTLLNVLRFSLSR